MSIGDAAECWPWLEGRFASGYGSIWLEGKNKRAHRVAYLLANGYEALPCCLHTCDNPICCNPNHLYAGTHKDNAADMERRGRHPHTGAPHGEAHYAAKLNTEKVLNMRKLYETQGIGRRRLARMFGVSASTAQNVLDRRIWHHV